MARIYRIARKEFGGFFTSPAAFIFFGVFLATTLFIFYWVETFFARNIADVRPLFEWMPVLLVFLVSAITMRMWSDERRSGTLEFLLTAPVRPLDLVLGKFAACVALVAVALALTLPLPVVVAFLGELDWGPVFGGYVATLFLAAAYVAIGLLVSARCENALVSLIVSVVCCGTLYVIGTDTITGLFGGDVARVLTLVGSGAHFDSIARGVLDFRDVYYYLSLVGAFLAMNVFVLEWYRWAGNASNAVHRRWALVSGLVVVNFLVGNLWIGQVSWARADLTQGNIYSISDSTRGYLSQLREPLRIRGYFSRQTHPLLAPLVPRVRDLLDEYAVAGGGQVLVEVIDPLESPELEQEAAEKFGVRPVAFQKADKYQAAVVNSYFDVVIEYGSEFEKLGFRDLIDVKVSGGTDLEVELRNPEYDITRTIKKVLYAYQGEELFENMPEPVVFRAYVSPDDRLPAPLVELRREVETLLPEIVGRSKGKLSFEWIDPDAEGGAVASDLQEAYGFRPMMAGLLDPTTFWFYLTLQGGDQVVQLPLPEDLSRAGVERGIDAGLKRFSTGLLRTVALHTPVGGAPPPMPGMPPQGGPPGFLSLRDVLSEDHSVEDADLEDGRTPEAADILVLAAPEGLTEKQLFSVDQFLMRGGTVIVSTSPFATSLAGEPSARKQTSGLEDWLAHHGVGIEETLVLDEQNSALPIPVQRRLGGLVVQELRRVEYPYFVDVRGDGLDGESGLMGGVNQVTMHWPSPIALDAEKQGARTVYRLLESSDRSWRSESLDLVPSLDPGGGWKAPAERSPELLAVALEGSFTSFFAGKDSPLLQEPDEGDEAESEDVAIGRVIDKSPESARLIVFASNNFLSDDMLALSSSGIGSEYLNPIQLVANAVDWSLEDRGLLAIRGRAQFSRTLVPLAQETQVFFEYGSYAAGAALLLLIWVATWLGGRARVRWYETILETARA